LEKIMAWLLIDNSNTRTKFRLGDGRGLGDWNMIVPTSELDEQMVRNLVREIDFSAVVVASVVPEKEIVLRNVLGSGDYHQLTHESPLGYGFELDAPEQIGHDRLANLMALKEKYGAPGIVIDFGTAVTFSVLSAAKNFAGGVIAAGIECSSEWLASRAAQLPAVKPQNFSSALGKTTLEALTIGATAGQRGMVKEILRELFKEIEGDPIVVATGGGAEFAAEGVSEIHQVDLSMTLEGLRLLAERVFR
jgi:type III pantothenate kinase